MSRNVTRKRLFCRPGVPAFGQSGRGAARLAGAFPGTPTRSVLPSRLASGKQFVKRT